MTDEHPEVRVGVLGAGFVARRHVEKLTTLAGVRISSVADPQRERAESLAERCGGVAVNSVEHVLDGGVDCLYVCVPPSEHGPPEYLAIAAGVPLAVEKPLAADRPTAEEEALTVRADGELDPGGPGDIAHAVTSTLRFDSGAVGSFSTTCLLPGGYRMAVELFAPGLALKLTKQDLLVVDRDGERTVAPQVDPVLEEDRQFIEAVRGREADLRSPYAEALRTHRLAWAVAEAARTGTTVGLTEAVHG